MSALFTFMVRLFVGAILLSAGLAKAWRRERFATTLSQYGLPGSLQPTVQTIIPGLEIAAGGALLVGGYWRVAAIGSACLLSCFLTLILWRRHSSTDDCGCGGVVNLERSWRSQAVLDAGCIVVLVWAAVYESSYLSVPSPLTPLSQDSIRMDVVAGLTVIAFLILLGAFQFGRFVATNWSGISAVALEHTTKSRMR